MSMSDKAIVRARIIVIWVTAFTVFGISILVVVLSQNNSGSSRGSSSSPVAAAAVQVPSAKDAASAVKCFKFHDNGPDKVGLSIDSGVCWIDGVKYGVNTFSTSYSRDTWVRLAESLGTNPPKWETTTSVIYKASDQTSDNS